MKWILLKGVYHQVSNINKIKPTDTTVEITFVGDTIPTVYHGLSEKERSSILKVVNNG